MTHLAVREASAPRRATRAPQSSLGDWGLRLSAIAYLGVMVAIPLSVVAIEGVRYGLDTLYASLTRPVALNALSLTLWTAALMTLINAVMGTLTAYILVKYRFPLKRMLNALIDLPFALPTMVTGVMMVLLYGPQTVLGAFFERELGTRIIFGVPGIVIALLFIGYPFVIRAVEPILIDLDQNQQDAAFSLGANAWQTFWRVIFPVIRPSVVTASLLSFARALGEFGVIIIVAGNIPNRTQTATVYIYSQVEGGNMQSASAVSAALLFIAFAVTFAVDWVERRRRARS
jgi:sulfate transport system permease protein